MTGRNIRKPPWPCSLSGLYSLAICFHYSQLCLACWTSKVGLDKDDCLEFPGRDESCQKLSHGRRQTADVSLELYRSVSQDRTVEQENFLLVPMELTRIVSVLIHGGDAEHEEKYAEAFQQIRCYVTDLTERLLASGAMLNPVEELNLKKIWHDGDEDEDEPGKHRAPRILQANRHIFVDKTLEASEGYAKEAFCWYDMPISRLDFRNLKQTLHDINTWARKETEKASELISNISDTDHASRLRKPFAGDPAMIRHDDMVVASSVYVRVAWAKDLFSVSDTEEAGTFFVKLRGEEPHKRAEMNVKIPMMQTWGEFPLFMNELYTALTLPLDQGLDGGRMILVLPRNSAVNLSRVESAITDSAIALQNFVDDSRSAGVRRVHVKLPRLTLQVTHEWATSMNKSLNRVFNDTGNEPLRDEDVGMYQDVFFEMMESTGKQVSRRWTEETRGEVAAFHVNQPFMFVLTLGHDILALGRIRDPFWCKFCPDRHGGGNQSNRAGHGTDLSEGYRPERETFVRDSTFLERLGNLIIKPGDEINAWPF